MKINKQLAHEVYSIRAKYLQRRSESKVLISWVEDHRLRSDKGKAIVFIVPTVGCSWAHSKSGGCSICGYIYDNPKSVDFEAIYDKFKEILKTNITENVSYSVKLFSSGSILDPREVNPRTLRKMLEVIRQYPQVKEVVLESRPEYVTEKKLNEIAEILSPEKVEIAIGLESANNKILKNSINKGFYWENFEKAAVRTLNMGMNIKAYLIFKPPFVSEYDSMLDVFESARKCIELGIDTISINPVAIHRGTYLNELFEKGRYRTPWLWSIVHLCRQLKSKYPHVRVICDPVSGGNERGAHNCGKCDKVLLENIKKFTLTQNVDILNASVTCICYEEWKSTVLQEKIELGDYYYYNANF